MKKEKTLAILTLISITITIIASFLMDSPFFSQETGQVSRIFYFHVPLAWISFFAFFVVMISSIQYLRKKERKYDIYALASAELGVLFSALTLITGSIWAKPMWGVWWRWDPRLTTTLITWIIYVAYLTLRTSLQTEKKARLSSVYGIIAFISVPITYLSIKNSLHPQPIAGGGISTEIASVLIIGVTSFTLLFFYMLQTRIREIKTEDILKILDKKRKNK